MKRKNYISDAEYRKYKKVASVFSTFVDDDVVILAVGRYGFVSLLYYTFPHGFDIVKTFTDSNEMFDFLWYEWLDSQLIRLAET